MKQLLAAGWLGVGAAAVAWAQQPPVWQGVGEAQGIYSASFSHSFEGDLNRAGVPLGDMSVSWYRVDVTPRFKASETYTWGVGLHFDYAHVEVPEAAPAPSDLYALAIRFLNDWDFSPQWSLRTDLRPGLYSDFRDISGEDIGFVGVATLGYSVSPKLILALGVAVDVNADVPVVGGPGVIWRFAEGWRLVLLPPKPVLEFSPREDLTFSAGVEWKSLAIRVAEDFGTRRGEPALDEDRVTLRELRALAGVRWRLMPGLTAGLEAGYAWDRRFEFDDAELLLNGDGAPFVQVNLGGTF